MRDLLPLLLAGYAAYQVGRRSCIQNRLCWQDGGWDRWDGGCGCQNRCGWDRGWDGGWGGCGCRRSIGCRSCGRFW